MLETNNNNREEKMEDKYYLTYILFYALGTLTLVPANFFTTANDYWMYKFRDPNRTDYDDKSNRTGLQAEFTSDYNIVANVFNVVFLIVTVGLLKKLSIQKRLIGALCMALALFLVTVIFVKINTDSWQIGFFVITLITGAIFAATGSIFIVSLFQMASKFPGEYLATILSGQSICGIFSALVQIFALSIGASSTTTGLIYFLVGTFFVTSTLILYLSIVKKSEFYKYHMNKTEEVRSVEAKKLTRKQILSILNKVKYYLLTIFVVLGCSIMVHPAVTSLVQSVKHGLGNRWNDQFFVPVITFLFYNVFDFLGRELSGKIQKPNNIAVIVIAGLIRIAFVPMIMYCNAQPRHHLPVVFNSDLAYAIFIIIFAFTNGYLINLCVIQIPKATGPEEKNIAFILIVIFMIVGMGVCSLMGAVLVNSL